MLIRDFAAVLKNKRQVSWHEIRDCELANDKVDVGETPSLKPRG